MVVKLKTGAKIYMAGPGVFKKDEVLGGWRDKAAALSRAGFVPLYPCDPEAGSGPAFPSSAGIFSGNVSLLRDCDAVLADVSPFRGGHMADDGTAFEIGFAFASGKPVFAFTEDPRSLMERSRTGNADWGSGKDVPVDSDGHSVEDFGHPVNLMLAESVIASGGVMFAGPEFADFETVAKALADVSGIGRNGESE